MQAFQASSTVEQICMECSLTQFVKQLTGECTHAINNGIPYKPVFTSTIRIFTHTALSITASGYTLIIFFSNLFCCRETFITMVCCILLQVIFIPVKCLILVKMKTMPMGGILLSIQLSHLRRHKGRILNTGLEL